jgi:hypothetical protein
VSVCVRGMVCISIVCMVWCVRCVPCARMAHVICDMYVRMWGVVCVLCTFRALRRGRWRGPGAAQTEPRELTSVCSCSCALSAERGFKLKFIFVELQDPHYL